MWKPSSPTSAARAGGWQSYVRYPRFKLLCLRIPAERGRVRTPSDELFQRLFPAPPKRRLDGQAHDASQRVVALSKL